MTHSKLSVQQQADILAWVETELTPWETIWADFDSRGLEAKFAAQGNTLHSGYRGTAESLTLEIGGGHGGKSHRANPSFKDLDLFFVLPPHAEDDPTLYKNVRSILFNWRLSDTLNILRKDGGMVPPLGIEISRVDIFLGFERDGVLWCLPQRCQMCHSSYYNKNFTVVDEKIVHTGCPG